MKYLLDTDHISIMERTGSLAHQRLMSRLSAVAEDDVALSIISFHEQTNGCHTFVKGATAEADLIRGYSMFERVRELYADSNVLPFGTSAAQVFNMLRGQATRVGKMDLRHAAVAIVNNLTLLTRNTVDFSGVPGLQFEDWTL